MDSLRVEKRNEYYKIRKERSEQGGGAIGASSTCDWCFGLYFVHRSLSNLPRNKDYRKDPFYENFKRTFDDKIEKKAEDSILYDKELYNVFFNRFFSSTQSFQVKLEDLNFKKVFNFNGSTESYLKLKELVKEPHIIFMLDKTWSNPGFNNLPKGEYYIFNEVRYKSSRKLIPD